MRDIDRSAAGVAGYLRKENYKNVRIAYGTVVGEIKEVSRSYKEAKMALDVGKIFFDEHLAQRNGQLINQTADTQFTVGNDIPFIKKDF